MNDQIEVNDKSRAEGQSLLNDGLGILSDEERNRRFGEKLKEERGSPDKCLWMSFCDTNKPKGSQFLGVVIVKSPGFAHAIDMTWKLCINPGGQVNSYEIDGSDIAPEHFDRLLTKAELVAAGYCDA